MSNILEQMLEESKKQLELEFEHKKELARIKHSQNNEVKELKEKYKKKISDLEAKLADTEFRYENLHNLYYKDTEELKQQLAEKDAEIEKWKSMTERSSSVLDRFNYCGESIIYNTTREQDKISFAVEQLTEIREYVKECWGLDELEGKVRLDIAKKIRLKIEQLKEMK